MSESDQKKWTFMIYMAGDNNLSEDMVTALIDLKRSVKPSASQINVLAFYDSAALGVDSMYFDFTTPEVRQGDLKPSKKIQGEKTSPESICDFVRWCIRDRGHVAENYALILSGHGEGYQEDTFLSDKNPYSSVTPWGLRDKLLSLTDPEYPGPTGPEDGDRRDFTLGQKFSIIGFDSCVMNTIEIVDELSGVADCFIGSQGFVPNAGWDYSLLFDGLYALPKLELQAVAQTIAKAYIQSNRNYAIHSGRSVDVGIVDLTRNAANFRGLTTYISAFGDLLTQALKDHYSSGLIQDLLLKAHWNSQTAVLDQCVDVGDFFTVFSRQCGLVEDEKTGLLPSLADTAEDLRALVVSQVETLSQVRAASDAVVEASKACVRSWSLGPDLQWATGLSLYFPWSLRTWEMNRNRYMNYSFSGQFKDPGSESEFVPNGWVNFLDQYLQLTFRGIKKSGNKSEIQRFVFALEDLKVNRALTPELDALAFGEEDKWNPPNPRWNPPNPRWNPPNPRWNPPNPRWNPPNPRGFNAEALEVFRRMKNFPLKASEWDPETPFD